MIPFHIDQINEMLKYLDELPHRFSRNIIDFVKNHVENHIQATEKTAKQDVAQIQQKADNTVAEIQQTVEADVAKIQQ